MRALRSAIAWVFIVVSLTLYVFAVVTFAVAEAVIPES